MMEYEDYTMKKGIWNTGVRKTIVIFVGENI